MPMHLKILSLIKNKLRKYLKDSDILDIIVFGSAVKGKAAPADIDIAIISKIEKKIEIPNFHITWLKPENFFKTPPSIIHTLFREGYSIKNNTSLSQLYKFSNRAMYQYELTNLNPSNKVKIVNILRGKRGEKGMVEQNKGEWLANQVFIVPMENENIFEKFFINFKIKYKKFFLLMH